MTHQATVPPQGKFYVIQPDLRGGGKGHGLEVANENKLTLPGVYTMAPPNGNSNQYPEKPHLIHVPSLGGVPRDMEGLAGKWILSEALKHVFERVDPEGFAFVACDYTLADGSPGPQHYLCNVIRTLDALDEEASTLNIEISDDFVNGKYYNLTGYPCLVFKGDVVGSAHIFRTPYCASVFCTRALRDAVEMVGHEAGRAFTGIRFRDAAKL